MKRAFAVRPPSPAMLVALSALFVGLGGTSYAAFGLGKNSVGTKQLKNGAVSTKKIKNGAVTAKKINTKGLTVPNALHANSADTATNATNATTAANANQLGGESPGHFLSSDNQIGTGGIVKVPGTATGNKVNLFSVGPFTVSLTCTKTGAGTTLTEQATSTEANSDLDGTIAATPGTATPLNVGNITTATTAFQQRDNQNIDFEAPSGAEAVLIGADAVNSLGTDCWANWVGLH